MKNKLLFLSLLLLIVNSTFAQWHFSASIVSYNESCGNDIYNSIAGAVQVHARKTVVEDLSGKTYSSYEECESARRSCTMNYSISGCYIRTTTTPCQGNVGGGGSSGGFYGEPSQHNSLSIGGEYFSQNETRSVDNRMMENEMMIQNEVLNKNWYNAVGAKTGDKIYDNQYIKQIQQLYNEDDADTDNDYNLRSEPDKDSDRPLYVRLFDAPSLEDNYYQGVPNMDNLQHYLSDSDVLTASFIANPQNLENILQNEFERVSNLDIVQILNKQPKDRTEDEVQILTDYFAFKANKIKEMHDELNISIENTKEKKTADAAIIALDVYGDDENGFINKTNYKKLDLYSLSTSDNPLKDVADLIDRCNYIEGVGFHAEMYYNGITDTYVISIEGSTNKEDWANNNVPNLANADVPQYFLAKQIGDAINSIPQSEREKLNLMIVGHSLGGGDASVIGLVTGLETMTFNASKVPDNFLRENGLYDKVINGDVQNITAYHTSTDPLTISQAIAGTPAVGVSKDVGNPNKSRENKDRINIEMLGVKEVVNTVYGYYDLYKDITTGHKIKPTTSEIYNNYYTLTKREYSKLKKMNDAKTRLQYELNHIEFLKQGF